jgi:hypothetical protein
MHRLRTINLHGLPHSAASLMITEAFRLRLCRKFWVTVPLELGQFGGSAQSQELTVTRRHWNGRGPKRRYAKSALAPSRELRGRKNPPLDRP